MGMDTVELVMAVEDEFSTRIPNEIAPKLGRWGIFMLMLFRFFANAAKPLTSTIPGSNLSK